MLFNTLERLGDAGETTKLTCQVRLTLRLSQDEVLGRGSPICIPADDRFIARLRRDSPSMGDPGSSAHTSENPMSPKVASRILHRMAPQSHEDGVSGPSATLVS